MAYDFKEAVLNVTEETTKNDVAVSKRTIKTRSKTRFQPIDQIMSRFDNMDAMFAAA